MVSVFHESHKSGRTSGQKDKKEFLTAAPWDSQCGLRPQGSLIRQTEHSERYKQTSQSGALGRQLVTPMKNSSLSRRRLTYLAVS